ncbi:MAG TPA: hypothetical protein VHM19_07450, partial [Polyangiales bacterium]|nr:hypothetical protein [Polyangiales bacterium]
MSTSPTLDPRERVVAALTAQDGTLRNAGLALVIDHVLAQPFAAWLDADTISTWIVQALSRPNAEREIARHVAPGVQRVLATLRASQERVGDAVPEEARAKLEALVTNPRGPRFAWMKGAVDADKLRALLAPVLQEIFVGFAGRIAPAGGGSAAGAAVGMVGRLGRGAGERLLNLGKSVADGLGVDVEARLREA